jgi:hypothetical protein
MSGVVRVVGGVVGAAISLIPGMGWLLAPSIALHLGGAQELTLQKPRGAEPSDPFREQHGT